MNRFVQIPGNAISLLVRVAVLGALLAAPALAVPRTSNDQAHIIEAPTAAKTAWAWFCSSACSGHDCHMVAVSLRHGGPTLSQEG